MVHAGLGHEPRPELAQRESHLYIYVDIYKPGDLFQGDKSAGVSVALRASAVGYEEKTRKHSKG